MKKLFLAAGCLAGVLALRSAEELVDGVLWHYEMDGGGARVVGGDPAYAGDLVVPESLGGLPVTVLDKSAFGFNPEVTSVVLPSGVTNLPVHAFCSDGALTNIVFRAPFVRLGESCLSGSGLRSFVVPEGTVFLETDVFHGAASLESVTLPSTLREVGRSTFKDCSSLREIRFPAGFEAFGEYWWEMHWPFYACTGLSDAYFLGNVPENFDCSGLLALSCRIHYPRAHEDEWADVVPADRFGGYSDMEDVSSPDPEGPYMAEVDGVVWTFTVVGGEACVVGGTPPYAGDLVVPESLGGLPVTGVDKSAFGFNPGVTSVVLPRGVTNLPIHAFCSCARLTNVVSQAAFIHYGESSLSGTALTRVAVPEGETRLEADVFHDAAALVSVSLPSTLRTMGRSCFNGCTSLEEIRFPAGFERFEDRSPSEERRAFAHCTGLGHSYFFGPVPGNFETSGLLEYGLVHYPRAYAAEWRAVVPEERFGGYSDGEPGPRPACVAGIAGYSGPYDGAGHGISVSDVSPATAVLSYALSEDGPYGPAAPVFTNVCNHVVWCRVEAPDYLPATRSAPVAIRPGNLTPADPSGQGPGTFPVVAFDGFYDGGGHGVAVGAEGMDVVYALREEDLRAGVHDPVPPVFTNVVDATVWYQVSASNYVPFASNAVVRIAPRPVVLSSRGGWKMYDGTPLVRDGVTVGGMGFVPGEGVEVRVTGAQTGIGASDNAFEWNPLPGTVTSNYEIAVSYGRLRVTKGPEGTVILIRGPADSVR